MKTAQTTSTVPPDTVLPANIRFDMLSSALKADPQLRQNLLTNYRRAQGGQQLNKTLAATLLAGAAGLAGYAGFRSLTAPSTRKKPVVPPESIIAEELSALKQGADVLGHITSDPTVPMKAVAALGGTALVAGLLAKRMQKQNPVGKPALPGIQPSQAAEIDQAKAEFDAALAAERLLAKQAAEMVFKGLQMGAVGPYALPASLLPEKAAQSMVTDAEPRAGVAMTPLTLGLAAGGGIAAASALAGILRGIKAHKKRKSEMQRTISRLDQMKPDQLALSPTAIDSSDRNVIAL